MWRRLYLTFPDRDHAISAAQELQRGGIDRSQMHAIDRSGMPIHGLPAANDGQFADRVWTWEQLYWNGNLALFGIALLGLVAALFNASYGWAIFCVAVMAVTFFSGKYFAENIPHSHLANLKETMEHGEVVLMIDVPQDRVNVIDREMSRHHPETGGHLVGWSMPQLGM